MLHDARRKRLRVKTYQGRFRTFQSGLVGFLSSAFEPGILIRPAQQQPPRVSSLERPWPLHLLSLSLPPIEHPLRRTPLGGSSDNTRLIWTDPPCVAITVQTDRACSTRIPRPF